MAGPPAPRDARGSRHMWSVFGGDAVMSEGGENR